MDRDIDRVIAELRRAFPALAVEQLRIAHPGADDDGVWFVRHPGSLGEVQLESSHGAAPFLVEGDDGPARDTAHSADEAVALVARRLGLTAGPAEGPA